MREPSKLGWRLKRTMKLVLIIRNYKVQSYLLRIVYLEDSVFYDREDPPMKVGTVYAVWMNSELQLGQHGIKEQFELATKKFCKELFIGFCKAQGCPWSIVERTDGWTVCSGPGTGLAAM